MRSVSIVFMLYATSMVFYGSMEMAHDLLHYLADHHIFTLHAHRHDHHHSMRDHHHGHSRQHSRVSHHHDTDQEEDESIPTVINIFLFAQTKPVFQFNNSFLQLLSGQCISTLANLNRLPPTPPPKICIAYH